jgi:hypothetical protein
MLASNDMSLLSYFAKFTYTLHYSNLPNYEVQVPIWLYCQIEFTYSPVHFAKSQSQQWPVVKSVLPSQHSKAANSTSPKATLPNCQVQILEILGHHEPAPTSAP